MAGERNAIAGGGGVVTAKKPPAFDHLVLLDNRVGPLGGKAKLGPLEAAIGFDHTKKHTLTAPDRGLQDYIDNIVKNDKQLAKTAFAVLDMSQKPYRYGGYRDTEALSTMSMGKMMIMIGAYQLRHDLRHLADDEKIKSFDKLVERAGDIWADAQHPPKGSAMKPFRAASPKIELENGQVVLINGKRVPTGANYSKTNLEHMFDKEAFDKGKTLDFRDDHLGYHQLEFIEFNYADNLMATWGVKTKELTKLSYMDLMKLMIGWSSNMAPRHLVADMNIVNVMSTLFRAHLFHPDFGGMWLGHPWNQKKPWFDPPIRKRTQDRKVGSPLAFLTLMAAIAENKIVDAASCKEMKDLLQKFTPTVPSVAIEDDPKAWASMPVGIATRSFLGEKLQSLRAEKKLDGKVRWWSKLGILEGFSDTAYIERDLSDGRKLRYVVAHMDIPDGKTEVQAEWLHKLAELVDAAIVMLNPPPKKGP
ncbi:MAG: serine hydrolase [Planctomycetota bacterium]